MHSSMDFGWRSIVLLIGGLQGLVLAGLLLLRRQHRQANRLLSALLVGFVLSLVPFIIGFAGAYDLYPWLNFAPTDVSLGYGPLLYLYVAALLIGNLPKNWWLHLVPVAFQVGYYLTIFVQPLATRNDFAISMHYPTVLPLETAAALTSAFVYWIASFRLFRRYRDWVTQQVSDSENYHLDWLRNFLVGLLAGFVLWLLFEAVSNLVTPLSYYQMFYLFLFLSALLYYFGVSGLRQEGLHYPQMAPQELQDQPSSTQSDSWADKAREFERRTQTERWHIDPELSLSKLARLLATNTWTLSRAINEGHGRNFNDFINAMRVAEVQKQLADPNVDAPILEIAMSAGFNSKTSFNRCFRRIAGETPSGYRKRLRPT